MKFKPENEHLAQQMETENLMEDYKELFGNNENKAEFETIKKTIGEYLRREHKVNEGNNAIIFKLELQNPQESAEVKEFAGKLLKVGNYQELKAEYENQKQAYEILKQAILDGRDPSEFAKIPAPYFCESFESDETIREHLKEEGVVVTGDSVGILLMDWIDGEDVATHLFKEALKRKESRYLDTIKQDNFNQLHQAVALEFEFAQAGGKATREGDRIYEQNKVESENEAKVFKYLKSSEYKFPAKTVDQIKNTLDLFKSKGLNMWDSHARNIMIDNEGQPYLIDFAQQVRIGDESITLDPYILARQLEGLTRSHEEDYQIEKEEELNVWDADYNRMVNHAGWQKRYLSETPKGEAFLRTARNEIGGGVNYVDDYIFALVHKVREGDVDKAAAVQMLQDINIPTAPPWRKEKINMAIKKAGV